MSPTERDPNVRQALETRGVGSVRALLSAHARLGLGGMINLGGLNAARDDVEVWLKEEEAADRRRKTKTVAAIVGAIMLAAVFTLLAFK